MKANIKNKIKTTKHKLTASHMLWKSRSLIVRLTYDSDAKLTLDGRSFHACFINVLLNLKKPSLLGVLTTKEKKG